MAEQLLGEYLGFTSPFIEEIRRERYIIILFRRLINILTGGSCLIL